MRGGEADEVGGRQREGKRQRETASSGRPCFCNRSLLFFSQPNINTFIGRNISPSDKSILHPFFFVCSFTKKKTRQEENGRIAQALERSFPADAHRVRSQTFPFTRKETSVNCPFFSLHANLRKGHQSMNGCMQSVNFGNICLLTF